jgi:hypothetical protein
MFVIRYHEQSCACDLGKTWEPNKLKDEYKITDVVPVAHSSDCHGTSKI